MSRTGPDSLTLFSLLPESLDDQRAISIIKHVNNRYLFSPMPDGTPALSIGLNNHRKSPKTLATLGRGPEADIYVEGPKISRIQCSFEINSDTGVIMFYDRSTACTSQVYGANATPFEHGRVPRRILVENDLNTVIGMGGERRSLIRFRLHWYQDQSQTAATIKGHDSVPCIRIENPRLARTVDEAPTEQPSQRETRIHTAGQRSLNIRYQVIKRLGAGAYGTVHKAVDVDSGVHLAVKLIERPVAGQESWKRALKREIEVLSTISHPHIVDFIATQGLDEPRVEIFMGLKEGDLQSLILEKGADPKIVAKVAFPQMLQALDYISWKGIVHRDVKPLNILYITLPDGRYQFQLGDFGICNRIIDAATYTGTNFYMAPEMLPQGGGPRQTHKIDVWALFVTILWLLNPGDLRQKEFSTQGEVHNTVSWIATNVETFAPIREMAAFDPDERASAAQILVKQYNGGGLTTPRRFIPVLTARPQPSLTIAHHENRSPTPSLSLTVQPVEAIPQGFGLQGNANIFAIAQYRDEQKRRSRRRRAGVFQRPNDNRPRIVG